MDKGKIGSGLHPVIIIRRKKLNKNFIYYNVLKESKLTSQISSILDNDLFLSTLNNCKILTPDDDNIGKINLPLILICLIKLSLILSITLVINILSNGASSAQPSKPS